eukprot:scpid66361/ scgid0755/ 
MLMHQSTQSIVLVGTCILIVFLGVQEAVATDECKVTSFAAELPSWKPPNLPVTSHFVHYHHRFFLHVYFTSSAMHVKVDPWCTAGLVDSSSSLDTSSSSSNPAPASPRNSSSGGHMTAADQPCSYNISEANALPLRWIVNATTDNPVCASGILRPRPSTAQLNLYILPHHNASKLLRNWSSVTVAVYDDPAKYLRLPVLAFRIMSGPKGGQTLSPSFSSWQFSGYSKIYLTEGAEKCVQFVLTPTGLEPCHIAKEMMSLYRDNVLLDREGADVNISMTSSSGQCLPTKIGVCFLLPQSNKTEGNYTMVLYGGSTCTGLHCDNILLHQFSVIVKRALLMAAATTTLATTSGRHRPYHTNSYSLSATNMSLTTSVEMRETSMRFSLPGLLSTNDRAPAKSAVPVSSSTMASPTKPLSEYTRTPLAPSLPPSSESQWSVHLVATLSSTMGVALLLGLMILCALYRTRWRVRPPSSSLHRARKVYLKKTSISSTESEYDQCHCAARSLAGSRSILTPASNSSCYVNCPLEGRSHSLPAIRSAFNNSMSAEGAEHPYTVDPTEYITIDLEAAAATCELNSSSKADPQYASLTDLVGEIGQQGLKTHADSGKHDGSCPPHTGKALTLPATAMAAAATTA